MEKTIKRAITLQEDKKQLERELSRTKEKIEQEQQECPEHISVIMGGLDAFPHYGKNFRCIICGKHLSEETALSIDVRGYLKNYDDRLEKDREEKFEHLQTMAYGIIKTNCTKEEFVDEYNSMIQESLALQAKARISSEEENKVHVKNTRNG